MSNPSPAMQERRTGVKHFINLICILYKLASPAVGWFVSLTTLAPPKVAGCERVRAG